MALAPCEKQHQEVRMGEKGKESETDMMLYNVSVEHVSSPCLFYLLQYVVVSSKKILFYNSEQDREQSIPCMVLDIE